jgi:DNA-binding transcriptional LysR family regulator
VANRVRRVAGGWEATLALSVDEVVSMATVLDLVEAFCALNPDTADPARAAESATVRPHASQGAASTQGPPTRLRIRTGVLAGTWEALVAGQADLAIGVADEFPNPGGIETQPLGTVRMVFCVAPHHALARQADAGPIGHDVLVHHRAVAVADTAQRLPALTVNLLPGQDVLTVPSMQAKVEALLRGLGCGHLPEPMARAHLQAGRLVQRATCAGNPEGRLYYAWRADRGPAATGRALRWWLAQLASPTTRAALIERHGNRTG